MPKLHGRLAEDSSHARLYNIYADPPTTTMQRIKARIELYVTLEKLVFAITSKILRIVTEHIDSICSLESRLSFGSICSIKSLNILEITLEMRFLKIPKRSTLVFITFP